MTKPKDEAERLLNTIVSSRARLAALRGDSVRSVEPTAEDDRSIAPILAPGRPEAVVTPEVQLDRELTVDPEQQRPLAENDLLAQEREPPGPSLVLGLDPEELEEEAADFDLNDLGLDAPQTRDVEPPAQSRLEPPIQDSLGLGVSEDSPPAEAPPSSGRPVVPPEPIEDDPFSFIDLLPPEPSTIDAPAPAPLTTPPPVRERPVMPIAGPLAAFGPPSERPQVGEPQRQTPLSAHSDHNMPKPAPESAALLSAPRRVPPRLKDPDRERLEVDIIEEVTVEFDDVQTLSPAPRLTETFSSKPRAAMTAPPQPVGDPTEHVAAGQACVNRGQLASALAHFSDALDWDASSVTARLARGRCRRDLGDASGALSDFILCQGIAPYSPAPHVEMGDLFFARKEYGRAIGHYDDALELQPDQAMALCRRGICHHKLRRASQAIEDLQQAARIDPNIPNIEHYLRMVTPSR